MVMHRMIEDNDGHWYVIELLQEKEFELWVDAMENNKDWTGFNFDTARVDGPHTVVFTNWDELL